MISDVYFVNIATQIDTRPAVASGGSVDRPFWVLVRRELCFIASKYLLSSVYMKPCRGSEMNAIDCNYFSLGSWSVHNSKNVSNTSY